MSTDENIEQPLRYVQGKFVTVIPSRSFEGHAATQDLRRFIPDDRVHYAMQIIEKHALICAEEDGEDSAGRQKLKRIPIEEIVYRACEISELAFSEFEKRGWMVPMPSPEDLVSMAKDNKKLRN